MTTGLLNVRDYEARARQTMPTALFDRMFGSYGAPDSITYTHNLAAFEALKLRPRVLVGESHRVLSTKVMGQTISFPVMLSPAGHHQRAHPQGELASARAAGTVGTLMALSIFANYSMEEVAEVATGPMWIQLYPFRDKELTKTMVQRAEHAGFRGLVLTVDQLGARTSDGPRYHRDQGTREQAFVRSHSVPADSIYKNFVDVVQPGLAAREEVLRSVDSDFKWSDLEWLRSITSLPMTIKGIQTAEDAVLCAEHGMDGLVVSNHGGLAMEGARGTLETLPEVVDAVGDRLEVFLDGGIRRGTDVLRALALGAKAVFIGRPMFWGLSVDGEDGGRSVLEILRDELFVTMGLMGVADVNKIDRSLVQVPNGWGRGDDDVEERLERLARLLEQGYLTRDAFDARKGKLLAQ